MVLSRVGSALVVFLMISVLVAGCTTSNPAPTGSASPSPSHSTSVDPGGSPSPPPLPLTGWGDRKYPAPCFPGEPTVQYEDGRATYRGFPTTARVAARGYLDSYDSVSIQVVCTGADWHPSAVLVYVGSQEGAEYVGLALSPEEVIDLRRIKYVDRQLELSGYGYARHAPRCCPDLRVSKTVALRDGGLVQTSLTKEPLKD